MATKIIERKTREKRFSISKQININFRTYALYVLEHRGIPSFYDGLTTVQRVILMNAPKTFNKTLSLVGSCILDKYAHGDKSLTGAINKVARPFGCAEQMLIGDGFFGSPVTREASAARYTSVKLNPIINELLKSHMVLNQKDENQQWEWLRTELPLGLLTHTVGIAVGYSTSILPRKLEEIQKFLDGKPANTNPYFKGFGGRIYPFEDSKKTWIIEGKVEFDPKTKTAHVTEIPPLMKYKSFIKKLSRFAEIVNFKLENESSVDIDIKIRLKGGVSWEEFKTRVSRMVKIMVSENLVLVKDGAVMEYVDILDYLREFKVHRELVRHMQSIHDIDVYSNELEFYKAKLEYLKFMLVKKRTNDEIEKFLSNYESGIKGKLDHIFLRDLSAETVKKTSDKILELLKQLKEEKKTCIRLEKSHAKMEKALPIKAKTTSNRAVVEMGDYDVDGIERFDIEEALFDDDPEAREEDENENED